MLKTSKVVSVQSAGTATIQGKQYNSYEVAFENGDVGNCLAVAQCKFIQGQTQSYEISVKGKFTNLKYIADTPQQQSAPAKQEVNSDKDAAIARAVALKAAVDLHKGNNEPLAEQISMIVSTAEAFEMYLSKGIHPYADAMHDSRRPAATTHVASKPAQDDDLPF